MEEQRPKRGCFLTGILWFILVIQSFSLISNFVIRVFVSDDNPVFKAMKSTSTAEFSCGMIFSILFVIAIILILMWKKQGAYLFGGLSAISFVVSFVIAQVLDLKIIAIAIIEFLISIAIAYFSFKVIKKREDFDSQE